MQHHINEEEGEELQMPQHIATKPSPPDPNGYSDGSLKNPGVGPHWMIGGIGVWWLGRKEATLPQTEAGRKFSTRTFDQQWYRAWNAFNNLHNSSTRCEIGASLLAMQPPVPVNIGVDNLTCVRTGHAIIGHASEKKNDLRTPEGAPRPGGRKT